MKSLDWLYSLEKGDWKLGLKPIKELLSKLGNPEKNLKCIHVAGTNGKGSVCAMISSILSQKYKVGMYTSPHLKRFNERIQINGKEISDEKITELIDKIKKYYNGESFFEITTAMAFLYFQEEKVDYAVLEVGLGGRLDATNVITPLVSIITNVSIDHVKFLGNTEEQIAYEKAGIIKNGVPVVTLAKGNSLKVTEKIAKEKKAPLIIPKKYNGKLNLKGEFQRENASLAISALNLIKSITSGDIEKGFSQVRWPGRFEFIEKNIVLDCAHNVNGLETLRNELPKKKIISVVGMMIDKDIKKMMEIVSSFSDYIILTQPKISRSALPNKLALYTSVKHEIISDVKKAIKKAKKIAYPEDLIVVTGSIYAVGEI